MEGWAWLWNSPKWHYFREGRSLCGRWLKFGSGGLEQGQDRHEQNCKACQRKRLAELDEGMTMKQRHKWVATWDDERAIGNSLIVGLVAGRRFRTDPIVPTHVDGFDTIKDALAEVRASMPCECAECQLLLKVDE